MIRLVYLGCLVLIALCAVPALASELPVLEQSPPEAHPRNLPDTAVPPELVPIGEDIADWQARWELARLLSYTKKYDASLKQYQRLLKEKPGLVKARIEMATVMAWAGKHQQAASILQSIPQKDLGEDARLALADILIAAKDYSGAEAILLAQLQSKPDDDASRLKLAELLSWTKRYGDSLKEYERILQHRPKDNQIRRKYAYVLIWAGQHDKAVQELRSSLGE